MANSYTQIYLQLIFAPKYRDALLHPSWECELHRYITGAVQNNGHKMICINSVPDHLHMFVGLNPAQSVSKMVQEVKANASGWINKNNFVKGRFEWQSGYGAFSYARSQMQSVCDYVQLQKQHHAKRTFLQEYEELLKEFEIDFRKEYVFAEPR